MLLSDNYGVTIYRNSGGTTATPFSNKISVEFLDRVFRWLLQTSMQFCFFHYPTRDLQGSLRLMEQGVTIKIVMPLNKDHCATSHWSKQFMP